MGLNAVVYKNRDRLPFDPERVGAKHDPRTGEYYFQDNSSAKEFGEDAALALEKRLGNVEAIEFLSEAVERALCRPDSLLQRKFLFNGTHSGDVIEHTEFDQLRAELAEVRRSAVFRQMSVLADFVQSIDDLLATASRESNPVVFV
jgi:hypothetical protein